MSEPTAIADRLSMLPAKVQLPFRQLLKVGQIDANDVSTILDAGELCGDSSKLLAFAAGFLHLKAQHVAVDDVIRMAKSQRRRINLSWTPKRWTHEHNRLSRAATLERLAADNVIYDVSTYEALLTQPIPGYLIHSSRRLGMEGLRQRHCVASYHKRLHSGDCAIACVFVDRTRWTVQLFSIGEPADTLRIGQIKTRYDVSADRDVRKKIYALLGVDFDTVPPETTTQAPANCGYRDTLRRVLPVLRAHGVERASVTFDGSGDEGMIDSIRYVGGDENVGAIELDVLTTQSNWDGTQWVAGRRVERTTLTAAMTTLTDDYLEETGVNWCDNDGGWGELTIAVGPGTVGLEVNARYTTSTTAFSEERDIVSGEPT